MRRLDLRPSHAALAKLSELLLTQLLDANVVVLGGAHSDQLIELGLDRRPVSVLRVLDQEHHEEGHDGGAGVDDELPGI